MLSRSKALYAQWKVEVLAAETDGRPPPQQPRTSREDTVVIEEWIKEIKTQEGEVTIEKSLYNQLKSLIGQAPTPAVSPATTLFPLPPVLPNHPNPSSIPHRWGWNGHQFPNNPESLVIQRPGMRVVNYSSFNATAPQAFVLDAYYNPNIPFFALTSTAIAGYTINPPARETDMRADAPPHQKICKFDMSKQLSVLFG